jgi:hypothetical protein
MAGAYVTPAQRQHRASPEVQYNPAMLICGGDAQGGKARRRPIWPTGVLPQAGHFRNRRQGVPQHRETPEGQASVEQVGSNALRRQGRLADRDVPYQGAVRRRCRAADLSC